MASMEEDGVGSLFEGMVLFDPTSELVPVSSSPPPSPLPLPTRTEPEQHQPPPSPATSSTSTTTTTSFPLDEDIFSDLTLLSPIASPLTANPEIPQNSAFPARQVSRKKKRGGLRVGYARESTAGNGSGVYGVQETRIHLSAVTPAVSILSNDAYSSSSTGSILSNDTYSSSPTRSRSRAPEFEDERRDRSFLPSDPVGSREEEDGNKDQMDVIEKDVVMVDDEKNKDKTDVIEKEVVMVEEMENKDQMDVIEKEPVVEQEVVPQVESEEENDSFTLVQRKLESIRVEIEKKLQCIREMASKVSTDRKELVKKRRKANGNLSSAAERHKELERELEEACEVEDFEKAEMISVSLADAEEEKNKCLDVLKQVEADCVDVESRIQEVLEMQIKAEEEAQQMLEQFAKDAAENADLVLKDAEEVSSKEMAGWQMSLERLEVKKMEMDVEMHLVDETRNGLKNSIEKFVRDDKIEKERLSTKHSMLSKELDELLALVKLKEAEITEVSNQMLEVENRISNVVDNFEESRSNIDKRHTDLQSACVMMHSESLTLSAQMEKINECFAKAEITVSKLRELATATSKEVRTFSDQVLLRKKLASPALKSREENKRLAKKEEGISEEIHKLRGQISAARSSLQELSSSRSQIQEQVVSFKQRIFFIDKRVPELEAEKKVAAAARNFKEAGRIATEAKSLGMEREMIQNNREKVVSELEEIEQKINSTLRSIEEDEELITVKEKEAASIRIEQLHLAAAAARAERFAARKMGDMEEGDILLQEAEDAESKAAELQETCNLGAEVLDKKENHISIALITSLSGDELAEIFSSLSPTVSIAPHQS